MTVLCERCGDDYPEEEIAVGGLTGRRLCTDCRASEEGD